MKKFFVLSLMVLSMVFLVSCGNSSSSKPEVSDEDGNQTDTDQTDDSDGGNPGDSGDSGETDADQQNDSGDTADDSDADSGDTTDDSDSNDSGTTEDIDPEFVADENLFEVPAGQNNTEGAPCDPETFVEFCDGNSVVYCEEEEIYDDEGETVGYDSYVEKYECEEEEPVCLTYLRNDEGKKHNWAACFSRCETIGKDSECSTDEDGFDFWYIEYVCKQTSKGKLLFYSEYLPCNSACSENGKTCKMEKCDPETYEATCDEDGVFHWCYESYGYLSAAFCEAYEGVCGYDEYYEENGCIYPDDDDEGDD